MPKNEFEVLEKSISHWMRLFYGIGFRGLAIAVLSSASRGSKIEFCSVI